MGQQKPTLPVVREDIALVTLRNVQHSLSSIIMCCSIYCLFCVVLCIFYVYTCTELLPPDGYPIAIKYIISSYHIYRIIPYIISYNIYTTI